MISGSGDSAPNNASRGVLAPNNRCMLDWNEIAAMLRVDEKQASILPEHSEMFTPFTDILNPMFKKKREVSNKIKRNMQKLESIVACDLESAGVLKPNVMKFDRNSFSTLLEQSKYSSYNYVSDVFRALATVILAQTVSAKKFLETEILSRYNEGLTETRIINFFDAIFTNTIIGSWFHTEGYDYSSRPLTMLKYSGENYFMDANYVVTSFHDEKDFNYRAFDENVTSGKASKHLLGLFARGRIEYKNLEDLLLQRIRLIPENNMSQYDMSLSRSLCLIAACFSVVKSWVNGKTDSDQFPFGKSIDPTTPHFNTLFKYLAWFTRHKVTRAMVGRFVYALLKMKIKKPTAEEEYFYSEMKTELPNEFGLNVRSMTPLFENGDEFDIFTLDFNRENNHNRSVIGIFYALRFLSRIDVGDKQKDILSQMIALIGNSNVADLELFRDAIELNFGVDGFLVNVAAHLFSYTSLVYPALPSVFLVPIEGMQDDTKKKARVEMWGFETPSEVIDDLELEEDEIESIEFRNKAPLTPKIIEAIKKANISGLVRLVISNPSYVDKAAVAFKGFFSTPLSMLETLSFTGVYVPHYEILSLCNNRTLRNLKSIKLVDCSITETSLWILLRII